MFQVVKGTSTRYARNMPMQWRKQRDAEKQQNHAKQYAEAALRVWNGIEIETLAANAHKTCSLG